MAIPSGLLYPHDQQLDAEHAWNSAAQLGRHWTFKELGRRCDDFSTCHPIVCHPKANDLPLVTTKAMKLSVIIPCFNEYDTILSLIEAVRLSPVKNKEIVLVDDGSTDGTREVLKSLKSDDLTIIFHEKNKGKGAALRTGFSHASGDICIVQDADMEYDPQEYPLVIGPILENKADVVFGSRFQGGRPHRVVYFWHRMGNALLTTLSNMLTDLNLSDMETCYKAFRREVIQSIKIKENRFGFEPEITAKVARNKDWRIYEVGISYYGRTYDQGKKIGWKDGIRAIYCILKYNLLP